MTPALPESVEIFDTTLRDGSSSRASRSPSTTSCASPSSSTTSACTTSRAAGPAPTRRTTSSSSAPAPSCGCDRSTLVAFGSTRRVKGKVDDDPTLRNLVEAGTSAVCIVGKCWDYHVTEALRTTLDEGVAMVADSVEFLSGAGLRVLLRRRALLRRLQGATPSSPCGCSRRPPSTAPTTLVLCDTNGGSLPHEVERDRRARSPPLRRRRQGRHPPPRRHRLRRGQRAGRRARRGHAGAGHDQRLRRAHRQLQPHDDHPQPHAEDGRAHACPRAASSGSPRWPTTSPSW